MRIVLRQEAGSLESQNTFSVKREDCASCVERRAIKVFEL